MAENAENFHPDHDEARFDSRTAHCWCWRTGAIDIAVLTGRSRAPRGAIVIAKGPASDLDQAVSVAARHAYDGVTLLVPGVPEAEDDDAAVDAVIAFRAQIQSRLDRYRQDRSALAAPPAPTATKV